MRYLHHRTLAIISAMRRDTSGIHTAETMPKAIAKWLENDNFVNSIGVRLGPVDFVDIILALLPPLKSEVNLYRVTIKGTKEIGMVPTTILASEEELRKMLMMWDSSDLSWQLTFESGSMEIGSVLYSWEKAQ